MGLRGVIFAVGGALTVLGGVLFIGGGGLSANVWPVLGLLFFEVGIGILVVEGVIGSALYRERRSRARSFVAQILPFVGAFDERAGRLVVGLSKGRYPDAAPGHDSPFSALYPFAGAFDKEALAAFVEWLDIHVTRSLQESRSAAHFLEYGETERLRTPLSRVAALKATLDEILQSRARLKERWDATMFILDQLQIALATARSVIFEILPDGELESG